MKARSKSTIIYCYVHKRCLQFRAKYLSKKSLGEQGQLIEVVLKSTVPTTPLAFDIGMCSTHSTDLLQSYQLLSLVPCNPQIIVL